MKQLSRKIAVLAALMGKEKPGKKPFKTLASTLNALPMVESL